MAAHKISYYGNETNNSWQSHSAIQNVRLPFPEHSDIYQLHLHAQKTLNNATMCDSLKLPQGVSADDWIAAKADKTLGTATMCESVKLPPGVNADEWIAAKAFGISKEVEIVVCLLDDLCKESECTSMTAGEHIRYFWACEEQVVPVEISAKQYMNRLTVYADKVFSNPDIVPTDGRPFPSCCKDTMRKLMKRCFRVYAHAYLHHFKEIQACDCEAHVNCCFKHFLFFVREFDLVSMEDMGPLRALIQKFLHPYRHQSERASLPVDCAVERCCVCDRDGALSVAGDQ